ncbi:MAG: acyl-CoA dehydrogenase [Bordetella sp. SCN 67-23]|nr:acyl-CoA/acyl-ACP dehydrogenase [Burkholderiales bacterium]ODS73195.1 MAG: acyl-CoA dehydrogenase [Bordetella sp. SCN 67-23]ODU72339.1 MAG: acyl-CoA dehydrogenase [Bordetella sp. SCN 68-11]OJW95144.1 MAG: acyl-CoA dehydrogenase [Burkholderiales bacterium 67-32]
MDFTIDEDIVALGDSILRFIDREVEPLEREHKGLLENERRLYGEDGRFVPQVLELRRRVRMRSAELGFYNLFAPVELGGDGMGALANIHVQELINARYGPARKLIQTVVLPSPFTNGLSPVLRHLDPAVFARYRDGIASGASTLCFGLSEPDAGSDVFAIKTRAERDGDGWVLSGTKQWITNAPYADHAMVFAVTDPGLAAQRQGGVTGFFVDTRSVGFDVPSVIPTMGHAGAEIGIVVLDKVRVPDSHRLGPVGQGFSVALGGVSAGRLSMAATCVGLAKWAQSLAVDYAKVRRTFGRPIGEHQAVQCLLADSAMDIYAAKSMVQNCAWRIDRGLPAIKETSMVKAHATEMLNRVMDRSIQVHGAMGLTNELRLEEGYRLARQMRIPDGTGEIQRRTIARQLLKGDCEL